MEDNSVVLDTNDYSISRTIEFAYDITSRAAFVVIEPRTLLRDCLECSIRKNAIDVVSFSSVPNWIASSIDYQPVLIILSIENFSKQEIRRDLSALCNMVPACPVLIVAEKGDLNDALEAINMGAKGYVPVGISFDVALKAMHFVSAGGTYLPVEYVLAAKHPSGGAARDDSNGNLTSRELAVIQSIRQGLSNKLIAYQLNMCESTVKVHVRHIMKKLRARNRTEVAIRGAEAINFSD
jgi:DNA-binding NarL/FixJ family response regulator